MKDRNLYVVGGKVARRARRLGMIVYVRESNNGQTFAIADDYGDFPRWLLSDVPMYDIKGYIDAETRARRIERKAWEHGVHISREEAQEAVQRGMQLSPWEKVLKMPKSERRASHMAWLLYYARADFAVRAVRTYRNQSEEVYAPDEVYLSADTLARLLEVNFEDCEEDYEYA